MLSSKRGIFHLFIIFLFSSAQANKTVEEDDETAERFSLYDIEPCRLEGGGRGKCTQLRNCPYLMDKVRHFHPGRVFQYLDTYTMSCGSNGFVCCPEQRRESQSHNPFMPPRREQQQAWTWPEKEQTTPGMFPWWNPASNSPQRSPPLFTERPPRTSRKPEQQGVIGTTKPPKKAQNTVKPRPGGSDVTRHKNRRLLPEDSCGVEFGNRVLGGDETSLEEHPWLALLRLRLASGRTTFICGGSLISSQYVLTAAHCVTGSGIPKGATLDLARLGEHNVMRTSDCSGNGNCNSPPQDIPVQQRIVHPQFTPDDPGTFNDIALLRLARTVKFNTNVLPVCLPLDRLASVQHDGRRMTTVGWGRTSNGAKANSPTKQKVVVPIVPFSKCAPQYRQRKVTLRDTQLCAGGEAGKDSCQGDSGGPLLSHEAIGGEQRWIIQGVVSTGPKECGKADSPAIYTRVSKFIPWILDNLNQ